MPYDVTIDALPERTLAVSRHTTAPDDLAQVFERGLPSLANAVMSNGGQLAGPPAAIYDANFDMDTGGDLMVAMPIAPGTDLGDAVEVISMPAQRVATTIHRGSYNELSSAYDALFAHVEQEGLSPIGGPIETYIDDPGEVDEADLRTQVAVPIED